MSLVGRNRSIGQLIARNLDAVANIRMPRTSLRSWRLSLLFLPTILATIYYCAIATNQYESEARFVVRSAARPELPGGLAFLIQLGFARSQDDSFIVQEYMTSRDAIEKLRSKLSLKQVFGYEKADFLSTYPSPLYGPSEEEFYKYFQKMVSIVHVDKTGISTLKVRAFKPDGAHEIAETLLQLSEAFVNRVNQRLQSDAVRNSSADQHTALQRLIAAQTAVTEFRNRELIVDPAKNAVTLAELVARLSAELATTQAQITELKSSSASSPQITTLLRKAAAIEDQIAKERAQIAGDTTGLASRIAIYERLMLEREFASRALSAAEAEAVRARSEAIRQLLYLERVVEPSHPDDKVYPKKIRLIVTFAITNLVIVLVGWLLFSGFREHASHAR